MHEVIALSWDQAESWKLSQLQYKYFKFPTNRRIQVFSLGHPGLDKVHVPFYLFIYLVAPGLSCGRRAL